MTIQWRKTIEPGINLAIAALGIANMGRALNHWATKQKAYLSRQKKCYLLINMANSGLNKDDVWMALT